MIALTGATGEVGRRVAALLQGTPHRLVVRDAARAPATTDDVRVARGYGYGDQMRAALTGAGTVFLIPAEEAPDRVEQHRTAIDAAVAAVLTSPGHEGATYDLTGPAAFSLAEVARALGARFHDETDEEAYASRAIYGAPDWEVEGWVSSYQAIRDGSLNVVSPHVRELTGRDPTGLDDYLERGGTDPSPQV